MHGRIILLWVGILMASAGCVPRAPACPEQAAGERFLSATEFAVARAATPAPFSTPVEVEMRGQSLLASKVVSGPLCNDRWRGNVYVTCDVKVAAWTETPDFLRGCRLEIEPGSIVYVAAHYNTAYYQGCSCHTGEIGAP